MYCANATSELIPAVIIFTTEVFAQAFFPYKKKILIQ